MTGAAPQWVPTEEDVAEARVTDFARFVADRIGVDDDRLQSLWQWSVDEPAAFWAALWDYFEFGERAGHRPRRARACRGRGGFPAQAELRRPGHPQCAHRTGLRSSTSLRTGPTVELSWDELLGRTAAFADTLRVASGSSIGDRVAGYLPNIPEAVIAFLATASIGAIWSACGQDYSAKAALDRLGQLEPVVLVTAEGYEFGGKTTTSARTSSRSARDCRR